MLMFILLLDTLAFGRGCSGLRGSKASTTVQLMPDRNTTADALDADAEAIQRTIDFYRIRHPVRLEPLERAMENLRDAARLLRTPDTTTDSGPTSRWYITNTGPEFQRHNIIAGPFTTREDALTARTAVEAIAHTNSYWVRPASEMTGGAS